MNEKLRDEYIVVLGFDTSQLSNEVNDMMSKGYKCQGGVATMIDDGSYVFYQAMIKYRVE